MAFPTEKGATQLVYIYIYSFLFLVVRMLLVVMPFVTSSDALVTSSMARSYY